MDEQKSKKKDIIILLIVSIIVFGGIGIGVFKTIQDTKEKAKTTNTNNTEVASYTMDGDYKVYNVEVFDNGCVSKLYLSNDNKLYGIVEDDKKDTCRVESLTNKVNGKDMIYLDDGIKDLYLPEVGQSGQQFIFYTKTDGWTYYLNNDLNDTAIVDIYETYGFVENNLKTIYQIAPDNFMYFEPVTNDNKAISAFGDSLYYDMKHGIDTTIINEDEYKIEYIKTEKDENENDYNHYFKFYKNGEVLRDEVLYSSFEIEKVEGSKDVAFVFTCTNGDGEREYIEYCINSDRKISKSSDYIDKAKYNVEDIGLYPHIAYLDESITRIKLNIFRDCDKDKKVVTGDFDGHKLTYTCKADKDDDMDGYSLTGTVDNKFKVYDDTFSTCGGMLYYANDNYLLKYYTSCAVNSGDIIVYDKNNKELASIDVTTYILKNDGDRDNSDFIRPVIENNFLYVVEPKAIDKDGKSKNCLLKKYNLKSFSSEVLDDFVCYYESGE